MTLTLCHAEALASGRPRRATAVTRRVEPLPQAAPSLTLERDRARRLYLAPGAGIECLCGRAWITLDGDLRDIVLEPGEAFVVDRKAPVMVFAFDAPTALRIRAPAGPRSPFLSGWRARAAYLAVVAGSALAFLAAHWAVAELADLAAAVSLSAAADGEGREVDARSLR
jgi:hypothetical protein